MIHSIILGLSALFGTLSQGNYYIEQEISLHQGWNRIETPAPWLTTTIFHEDRITPLPKMLIAKDGGTKHWKASTDPSPASASWILEPETFADFQTHLLVYSESSTNVIAHFYNPTKPLENLLASAGVSDQGDLNIGNFLFGDELLDGVDVQSFKNETEIGDFSGNFRPRFITRSGWGADESLRKWKPVRGIFRFFRKSPPEAKYLTEEFKPKIVTKNDESGDRLTWPIEKNPKVSKIILHHTGEFFDDRHQMRQNPKAHVRAIYAYHTITRGWGDIGYNFLIDKRGDIYEGRAGGPETVGAHTAYYNAGTQGISLIGNFNVEQPTQEQIKSLSIFLAYLSSKYDIDPLGKSNHLRILSHNITGHRFVARRGHSTSCPGENVVKVLPALRKKVAEIQTLLKKLQKEGKLTTRDFLQKSPEAQKFLRKSEFKLPEKTPPVSIGGIPKQHILQRGRSKTIEIEVRNTSNTVWKQGSQMEIQGLPSGMIASNFRAIKTIPKGFSGIFRGKISVKTTPNGKYYPYAWPSFLEDAYPKSQLSKTKIEIPIQVSGSQTFSFANYPLQASTIVKKPENFFQNFKRTSIKRPSEPDVKIKIAGFTNRFAEFSNTKSTELWTKKSKLADIPAKKNIKIFYEEQSNSLRATIDGRQFTSESLFLKNPAKGIFTIKNYQNPRFGEGRRKYNTFRGEFHLHPDKDANSILVVNELPLEKYLAGLAEEPAQEPEAKKHAIYILARSYAYVYSGTKRKFRTNLYDLEDDPRTSQLYLGHEWEQYHSDQKALLAKTRGKVITHNGKAVIGPYFTQSSGKSSAKWQKQYPWTQAQVLPFDKGLDARGHGVGLSGNSARELAKQGKSYTEILNYFFKNIRVQKRY